MAAGLNRSERKHKAILDAATQVFLRNGYLGTNMDDIAALSAVSKQTVYKHFESKEALFIEIVTSMVSVAGDTVHERIPQFRGSEDLAAYLLNYGYQQLSVVLTPQLMQLRRLVIGEVSRFPNWPRCSMSVVPNARWHRLPRHSPILPDRVCLSSTTLPSPHRTSTGSSWPNRSTG